MKLGIKMFFCITIFFSAAFLCCGATLISYFYKIAIEKEVENTAQLYQYNKFVIQAALITREDDWVKSAADGSAGVDFLVSDMNGTVALYTLDGSRLFSGFPDEAADFSALLANAQTDSIRYQFVEIQNRMYLLISGSVKQNDTGVYLITGVNIQKILQQQERILQKFGYIYAVALGAGVVLIFVISALLTRPVKLLTAATQKIADGNYAERVAASGNDEFGQLARNFNQMACAIEEKISELSESARQKEDFAANFAHELKTPLTSVIGYADRIYKKELPREAQKQAAWHIWNEGMRLEALSQKLMDLTVFHHKQFVLQEMDAAQLLGELAADVEYLVTEKGIAFAYTAQQAYIRAEYDLFKTLFLNLIDNAVKAGASSIQVNGCIQEPGAGYPPGKLPENELCPHYIIRITDNGCGIPPDEIKRITEAFYMVDKSRSRKLHGAGLGLSLAQKIAEIHAGSLDFESDGSTGTTVTISLTSFLQDTDL
ncbi:MAG: HAMP domain-containing histidine kinase [Eubacterium sp.]|nr:HAMP domain-containing histidine kinase [Eubacterium sp.]